MPRNARRPPGCITRPLMADGGRPTAMIRHGLSGQVSVTTSGALARRIAHRLALGHHRVKKCQAVRRDRAAFDCRLHRASRLPVVAAIPEATLPEQRPDLDERPLDRMRRQVREAERLHSRRVDDPPVGAGRSESDEATSRSSCGGRSRAPRRSPRFGPRRPVPARSASCSCPCPIVRPGRCARPARAPSAAQHRAARTWAIPYSRAFATGRAARRAGAHSGGRACSPPRGTGSLPLRPRRSSDRSARSRREGQAQRRR